ncbi:hypothetical protein ECANGB1_911 [Enterospora canceri]|uniref:Thioredoxin domain-containing protein n=1 Tax=Enterospora canceri TaxID=1081671 RepID=A0A1Y1S795_9MICR|nr:hypothetical protein ECANGB1_911 [Enterospora canceri]
MVVKATESFRKTKQKIEFIEPRTEAGLNNVNSKHVLVKASLPGCPPCKFLQEYLEKLEFDKKLTVVKINADDSSYFVKQILLKLEVSSVPVFALCTLPDFKVVDKVIGFNETKVNTLLERALK